MGSYLALGLKARSRPVGRPSGSEPLSPNCPCWPSPWARLALAGLAFALALALIAQACGQLLRALAHRVDGAALRPDRGFAAAFALAQRFLRILHGLLRFAEAGLAMSRPVQALLQLLQTIAQGLLALLQVP